MLRSRHRVLMVTANTLPGGQWFHVVDLAHALLADERVEAVRLFTGRGFAAPLDSEWRLLTGHPPIVSDWLAPWMDVKNVGDDWESAIAAELRDAIELTGATVLHGHDLQDFGRQMIPVLQSLMPFDIPLVHTTHDAYGTHTDLVPFDADMYVSEYLKRLHVTRQPERCVLSRNDVVMPGVNRSIFAVEGDLDPDVRSLGGPIIGVASRPDAGKGVDVALAAFARLRPRLHERGWFGSFVVAMPRLDPPQFQQKAQEFRSWLIARAGELDIAKDVHLVRRTRRELAAFYRSLDILWQPSTLYEVDDPVDRVAHEGLGMAAMEARATGCPVIVTDSGGAMEAVPPSMKGFSIVRTGDADDLATTTETLFDEPRLLAELAQVGLEHVEELSSTWVDRTLAVYDNAWERVSVVT